MFQGFETVTLRHWYPGEPGRPSNTKGKKSKSIPICQRTQISKLMFIRWISNCWSVKLAFPTYRRISLCTQHATGRWCVVWLGFIISIHIKIITKPCNIFSRLQRKLMRRCNLGVTQEHCTSRINLDAFRIRRAKSQILSGMSKNANVNPWMDHMSIAAQR